MLERTDSALLLADAATLLVLAAATDPAELWRLLRTDAALDDAEARAEETAEASSEVVRKVLMVRPGVVWAVEVVRKVARVRRRTVVVNARIMIDFWCGTLLRLRLKEVANSLDWVSREEDLTT